MEKHKETLIWLGKWILAFVACFILTRTVIQPVLVIGSSMETTYHDGNYCMAYRLDRNFERYDVIAAYAPTINKMVIKRVIGLPGETIKISGNDIYINGEKIKDGYGREPIKDPGLAANGITLGEDEYFVMGDNRNNSTDSRSRLGNIEKKNIIGKIVFKVNI